MDASRIFLVDQNDPTAYWSQQYDESDERRGSIDLMTWRLLPCWHLDGSGTAALTLLFDWSVPKFSGHGASLSSILSEE
jgi:hypothetical protein